jgi:hypothetical protein
MDYLWSEISQIIFQIRSLSCEPSKLIQVAMVKSIADFSFLFKDTNSVTIKIFFDFLLHFAQNHIDYKIKIQTLETLFTLGLRLKFNDYFSSYLKPAIVLFIQDSEDFVVLECLSVIIKVIKTNENFIYNLVDLDGDEEVKLARRKVENSKAG